MKLLTFSQNRMDNPASTESSQSSFDSFEMNDFFLLNFKLVEQKWSINSNSTEYIVEVTLSILGAVEGRSLKLLKKITPTLSRPGGTLWIH